MSQKEQIEKVAFACQVPTEPRYLEAIFVPSDLTPPPSDATLPPVEDQPPFETANLVFPGEIPPMQTPQPPFADAVYPPSVYAPPFLPPVFATPPFPGVSTSSTPPPGSAGTPPAVPPVVPPVAPVPEPTSWALLGTGLVSLVAFARRTGGMPERS
jgi:hypothetical protein